MAELLLLAVCGTIADCDDYDAIAVWGDTHLDFLRRFLPYHHGVPSGRWLTIMMNRIDPALFSACFTSWVRACWPYWPELVAIDGKTSRRSHDRGQDRAPLHLVSAFATTSRLVLGQEAVAGKSNELTAIPALLERLAAGGGLRGAIVTIDAIACNGAVAKAVREAGAHYLLAVKANQPTLRDEIERFFKDAEPLFGAVPSTSTRVMAASRPVSSRSRARSTGSAASGGSPANCACPTSPRSSRVESKAELKDRCRFETRYYVASTPLSAQAAAAAVRGHWGIENQLHWVLDVVFNEDQFRAEAPTSSCAISPWIRSEPRKNKTAPRRRPPDRVASIPAPPRAKPASSFVEKSPDGTSNIYKTSSAPMSVNLDFWSPG